MLWVWPKFLFVFAFWVFSLFSASLCLRKGENCPGGTFLGLQVYGEESPLVTSLYTSPFIYLFLLLLFFLF